MRALLVILCRWVVGTDRSNNNERPGWAYTMLSADPRAQQDLSPGHASQPCSRSVVAQPGHARDPAAGDYGKCQCIPICQMCA